MSTQTLNITRSINVTREQIKDAENYLRYYGFYQKLIKLDKYEQDYFGGGKYKSDKDFPQEISLAHAKMFEIRHFIMEMQNCDEKLLLYYHYVKGNSVDKCAELIGVSRSSAFRLKRRALALAAEKYFQRIKKAGGSD